jgi:uncharacterized protein (TIGR00725 family)
VICVAIVGPGESASPEDADRARAAGALVAAQGWVTLVGGRDVGVMHAAADGAASSGGTVIGILPGSDREGASDALTIALPTGLGEARNAVLVNSADAIVCCGISPGTLSEVALALKAGKPTLLIAPEPSVASALLGLAPGSVRVDDSAESGIRWVAERLGRAGAR